jgi:hypothetical protein
MNGDIVLAKGGKVREKERETERKQEGRYYHFKLEFFCSREQNEAGCMGASERGELFLYISTQLFSHIQNAIIEGAASFWAWTLCIS